MKKSPLPILLGTALAGTFAARAADSFTPAVLVRFDGVLAGTSDKPAAIAAARMTIGNTTILPIVATARGASAARKPSKRMLAPIDNNTTGSAARPRRSVAS